MIISLHSINRLVKFWNILHYAISVQKKTNSPSYYILSLSWSKKLEVEFCYVVLKWKSSSIYTTLIFKMLAIIPVLLFSATSPCITCQSTVYAQCGLERWGGNIRHSRQNPPIDEWPEPLVSYDVCAFKLHVLWYVIIEGSVAVSNRFCLDKTQKAHWW